MFLEVQVSHSCIATIEMRTLTRMVRQEAFAQNRGTVLELAGMDGVIQAAMMQMPC